jgi:hypothetical protein
MIEVAQPLRCTIHKPRTLIEISYKYINECTEKITREQQGEAYVGARFERACLGCGEEPVCTNERV